MLCRYCAWCDYEQDDTVQCHFHDEPVFLESYCAGYIFVGELDKILREKEYAKAMKSRLSEC